MKVYLATSSIDLAEVDHLMNQLRLEGFEVFDWPAGFREVPHRKPASYALEDLAAIKACDVLVWAWLTPSQSSFGAHFEAGYAAALGKPVIIYVPQGEPSMERIFASLFLSQQNFEGLVYRLKSHERKLLEKKQAQRDSLGLS